MQTLTHASGSGNTGCFVLNCHSAPLTCTQAQNLPQGKKRKKKKNLVGTGGSFLSHQRKHTKENSAPFSHHENTRHLNVSGLSLYWDWCETTFPLRCTIRRERVVHVDRRPLWGPSVWGELQSSGPSAPWRRWISYMRRCQDRPNTNQTQTHTHTYTHLHRGKHDKKDLVSPPYFHTLFQGGLQKRTSSRTFNHLILTRFSSWCRSCNTKGVQGLIKSDTRSF